MAWSIGDNYDPNNSEPIVCHWLRTPYPWIVVAGEPSQVLRLADIAYTRFTGHDAKAMIVIYGPPKLIKRLDKHKCRHLYRPLGSSVEGGIIKIGEYNPWSSGPTGDGMPSPVQSSNT